ncbi:hypothetical protein H8959_009282 [Pygathrix nigripes]
MDSTITSTKCWDSFEAVEGPRLRRCFQHRCHQGKAASPSSKQRKHVLSGVENEAHSPRAKPRQRPQDLFWRWKLVENPDCLHGLPS